METDRLLDLYKEFYFRELDAREKVEARLQFSATLILAEIGLFGFLFTETNIELNGISVPVILFIVMAVWLLFALIYWGLGFWGHTYFTMPTAQETESHRNRLESTYNSMEGGNQIAQFHFNSYLIKYFSECADLICKTNEKRAFMVHRCNACILAFIVPAFVFATLMFDERTTGANQHNQLQSQIMIVQ